MLSYNRPGKTFYKERNIIFSTQATTLPPVHGKRLAFFPFNPNPEAWKNMLSTIGGQNNKIKKKVIRILTKTKSK